MNLKLRIFCYLTIYIVFVLLYMTNFKYNLDYNSLKICLSSSILPALVGGTVSSLLVKESNLK